jgi:outer membrane protein OmpA-like peptidoglycan-associated protein
VAATAPLAVFYGNDAANRAPDAALMDRGGMPSSPLRLSVIRTLPFISALVLLAVAALPATAQTVVGSNPQPSVTVDLSVLESLGPPPTLPDVLRGRKPPGTGVATRSAQAKGVKLRPPKKKATAKATPKGEAPTVAAHPAPPIAPVAVKGTGPVPRESVAATPLAEPTPAAVAPETPAAAAGPAPAPPEKPSAPAAPATPTAAPPSPVPTVAPPPPATATAMNTPPSLPPEAPVKSTPAAAPAAVAAASGPARILFSGDKADLPDNAKGTLDAVAQRLSTDAHLRLQLVAFASGTADQANQARRVSLQRALAVRSYLMEHGVANTRMDVRALGNRNEGEEPPDRVDIVMLEH